MSIAFDNDLDVQSAVQDELAWTPDVDAEDIGVAVRAGTVELFGQVDSYAEKVAAEKAAHRVRGVRTIVNEIRVHPKIDRPVSSDDIAKEVDRALLWAVNVPSTVQAEVDDHVVTLTGDVDWDFQRKAAVRSVQHLYGVHDVNDKMSLRQRPAAADTEQRIRRAIERNAELDANTIHVTTAGNTVTLTGTVNSWAEKQQASRTAWASPHVLDVQNEIVVRA
ncbi:BON domain-containing protein [Humibacter sp.]|uniref:BON domain-containing protein n=1 Tax=Humibacter sp. TaxID=1940291 RepID=UPI003F7E6F3E